MSIIEEVPKSVQLLGTSFLCSVMQHVDKTIMSVTLAVNEIQQITALHFIEIV